MARFPFRPLPRPGWRFWLGFAALVWCGLAGAAVAGAAWGVGELQQASRFRAGGEAGRDDALDQVTAGYRFDIVGWEAQELGRWVLDTLGAPPGPPDHAALAQVTRYFELGTALRRARLRQAAADTPEARSTAAAGIDTLQRERDSIEAPVRQTLNALVARQLHAAGLGYLAGRGEGPVLPPVAFSIVRPPSILAVAPRDAFRLERTTVLEPNITDAQGAAMEAAAEQQGWSAVVEPLGGFSTYPTIVSNDTSLDFALQTIAHEWAHTYLFFRPLGFNYFSANQMRTINETVANLVGREVSKAIVAEWFPPTPAAPPAATASPTATPTAPATPTPAPFNFTREMRETRLQAEELLKAGKLDEAEAYMEERRKLFVQRGYAIRRLNQAYFAFHGSYADTPGSVDPIGPALDRLLRAAGSVQAFVQAVEGVGSYADYLQVLARFGVDAAPPAVP